MFLDEYWNFSSAISPHLTLDSHEDFYGRDYEDSLEFFITPTTLYTSLEDQYEQIYNKAINASLGCMEGGEPLKPEEANMLILLNPRTGLPVSGPFGSEIEPHEEPTPYTPWSHDHDYAGKRVSVENVDENSGMDDIKVSSESEPNVDVWEIESFPEDPQTVPDCADVWNRYQTEGTGRRSSSRTAQLKIKMEARKLTNALCAGLTNEKAKRTRQRKSIKPKNSVETTPSQSDIEECSSYRVRPTNTKTAKKKTSKGRIDHSESERHRREVLRSHFTALSKVVPDRFLRGEKVSAQISKQKILNGAKAYIDALESQKTSCKSESLQHKTLHLKLKALKSFVRK